MLAIGFSEHREPVPARGVGFGVFGGTMTQGALSRSSSVTELPSNQRSAVPLPLIDTSWSVE